MCAATFTPESSLSFYHAGYRGRDLEDVVLAVGAKRWPSRAEPQTAKDASGLSSVSPPTERETETERMFNRLLSQSGSTYGSVVITKNSLSTLSRIMWDEFTVVQTNDPQQHEGFDLMLF